MIARANAYRQYNVATEDMEAGDYLNAIQEFDLFLAANPADDRADKARVLRRSPGSASIPGASGPRGATP